MRGGNLSDARTITFHVEAMTEQTRRVVCERCGWSMGFVIDLPSDDVAVDAAKDIHKTCEPE